MFSPSFFLHSTDLSVDSMSRTKLAHLVSSRCSMVMPEDLKGDKLVDLV